MGGSIMEKQIKSFKVYSDDADEERCFVTDKLEGALEILENNGYIVEVEYSND